MLLKAMLQKAYVSASSIVLKNIPFCRVLLVRKLSRELAWNLGPAPGARQQSWVSCIVRSELTIECCAPKWRVVAQPNWLLGLQREPSADRQFYDWRHEKA